MIQIPNTRRLMTFCGFARASGELVSGTGACESAIRSGKARLVILSGDASENTVKHFSDMADFRHIPCLQTDDDSLGKSIGYPQRKTAVFTGDKFAAVILREFNLEVKG